VIYEGSSTESCMVQIPEIIELAVDPANEVGHAFFML
jgi:hypothetical protein